MSYFKRYRLVSPQIVDNAIKEIRDLEVRKIKPHLIEIKEETRTLEQNAKLHAMLMEIKDQKMFKGRYLSLNDWKALLISGHNIATGGEVNLAVGLEGELINLRESSSQMNISRLSSLIEYIYAWGVNNGVKFSE